MKNNFTIREIKETDREWVRGFIAKEWGSEKVVSRGRILYPHKLPGFVALKDGQYVGLITYNIENNEGEIVSINSLIPCQGIGKKLVGKVIKKAKENNLKRVWCITTNDNIEGLIFWQKVGFCLKAVYPKALEISRKLKPEISKIGHYGIPLRDEIELEYKLN